VKYYCISKTGLSGLVAGKQAHYHNYDSDKKHEQGNTVHAMHKAYVNVFRIVGISLTNIEVCEDLLPDTLFHDGNLFNKVTKIISQSHYICTLARGISSSGRAFAWHAKGNRFDSGILH
jgi:hypothetical protein